MIFTLNLHIILLHIGQCPLCKGYSSPLPIRKDVGDDAAYTVGWSVTHQLDGELRVIVGECTLW